MVDVSSFYCVKRVSAFGHGNMTVNLPCGLDSEVLINLWSWRIWAYYAGEPYFCGVPTGLQDQDGSAHVQFTLLELPGYLTRRQQDQHPFLEFVKAEQTTIARQLAEPAQEVGVVLSVEPGPGKLRDRKYEFLEGGSRGQLLVNLAGVLDGPEFRSEYRTGANGRPQCVLRIAYPRVGSDSAGLGVAVPGAILNYRFGMDSDQLRTHTFAVGDLPSDRARRRGAASGHHLHRQPGAAPARRLGRLARHHPGIDAVGAVQHRDHHQFDPRAGGHRSPARVPPVHPDLRARRHGDGAGSHSPDT